MAKQQSSTSNQQQKERGVRRLLRPLFVNGGICAFLLLLLFSTVIWFFFATRSFDVQTIQSIDALKVAYGELSSATENQKLINEALQSPSSTNLITDTLRLLSTANDTVNTRRKAFILAGSAASHGEIIILFGAVLQVAFSIAILYALVEVFLTIFGGRIYSLDTKKEEWRTRISKRGESLIPQGEDKLLRFVRDEGQNKPQRFRERGRATDEEYRKLVNKQLNENEEPSWTHYSKLLFKLHSMCYQEAKTNEDARELEAVVRTSYSELQRIIWRDFWRSMLPKLVVPLIFFLAYLSISSLWNEFLGSISLDTLGMHLASWQRPILFVSGAAIAIGVVNTVLKRLAYWFTERTWIELDDILAGIATGPLSAVVIAAVAILAIDERAKQGDFAAFLAWTAHFATGDTLRSIVTIVVLTGLVIFLLNRVVIWSLDRWAARTAQKYDDLFAKLIQVFGNFIVLAIGVGALLAVFSDSIRDATGIDNILLPYTIVVSVFTAVLGYASRAAFENFFGGVLLQIEKPFFKGERIVLPDGKICDVRDVGMRSTTLYNVLENTEVSVPNSEISKMTITNTSRPDIELRISIPVWIVPRETNLMRAEALLLDIAYLDEDIDQMRVSQTITDDTIGVKGERFRRSTIKQEFQRLRDSHEKVKNTIVLRMVQGGKIGKELVFDKSDDKLYQYEKVLDEIDRLQQCYQQEVENEQNWLKTSIKIPLSENVVQVFWRAIRELVSTRDTNKSVPSLEDIAKRQNIPIGELRGVVDQLADSQARANPMDDKVNKIRTIIHSYEERRLGLLVQITDWTAKLGSYIFAIAEQHSEIRSDLDLLISEYNKEPVVFSDFSEDGTMKVVLNCYAIYLERRFEVANKLNREIEWRFSRAGIEFKEQ